MYHGIYEAMKEGLFVPTHKIDGVVVNKPEKDWTKDDKEMCSVIWRRKLWSQLLLVLIRFCEFSTARLQKKYGISSKLPMK